MLALQAEGRCVTSVEGLTQDGERHPLQQAFIDCHGLQCGFCTPGMIMSTAALLARTPQPSQAQIDHAIEGNLCRCTGYVNIVAAVKQAAATPATGAANERRRTRFGRGQTVRRIEDPALVAGNGQFTDDVALAGQTLLSLPRSPYAHARIVSIDAAAALAMPGVLAVYSGADLVEAGVKPMTSQPFLSRPQRCVGPETPPRAGRRRRPLRRRSRGRRGRHPREAALPRDAVIVDYDELPNVVHLDDAVAAGAPRSGPRPPTTTPPKSGTATPPPRRGPRAGRARGRARPRQPAARAHPDGAARRAGQPRGRPDDVRLTTQMPTACATAVRRGLGWPRPSPRDRRRRRRRLRHEDRRLPRRHRRRHRRGALKRPVKWCPSGARNSSVPATAATSAAVPS